MKSEERRRYFRIDDEMILSWRILDKAEKKAQLAQFESGDISYPDPAKLYLSLEADISALIQQLSPREVQIAEVLKLLNRKINLLSKGPLMNAYRSSILDESPQYVNISACGMAFMAERKLDRGMDLQIELVLVPENIYILCYGVVIDCVKAAKGIEDRVYRINVDFSAIKEEDRERLIQHIMQKEMTLLQSRRKTSATK